MANRLIFLLAWYASALYSGQSLKCYECAHKGSVQDDCTTGECVGEWCLITTVMDDDDGTELTVKNCANTRPIESDTSDLNGNCQNVVNGGVQYTICACKNGDYCNNQPTVARILSNSAKTVSNPAASKKVKCRLCSAASCRMDEAGLCEEQWCIAQLVHDRISNETLVSKRCSSESHDGKGVRGCIHVPQSSSEVTICSCNEDYCTDEEPLRLLIGNRTIATSTIGSAGITSALSNSSETRVVEKQPNQNATQEFLKTEDIITSATASFSISLSIIFLQFLLTLFAR
uniref:Uncharacterized protein n=1 Tax=Plectus sambesii TaxID=2011161 RepID=A0A914VXS3_9BILA